MNAVPLHLIVRTRWKMLLFLAVAVVICAISAVFFIRYLVKPYYGLTAGDPELNLKRGGLVFLPDKPDSPARQAGLKPGLDVIAAVNGRTVSSVRQLKLWEYGHLSFEPVVVSVTDPAGEKRSVTVTPELSVSRYDWFFGLLFLIVMGGIALYIITHYHHEITHTLFALLVLCFVAYTAVRSFSYENLLVTTFVNLGELTAWLMILFIVFFQKDLLPSSLKRVLITAVIVIITAFSCLRYTTAVRWFLLGGDRELADLRLVDLVQNYADIPAYAVFLFILVVTYFRTAHHDIKRHLEWIMAGALLSIPPHFLFGQVPHFVDQESSGFPQLGMASSFFLVFLPLSYVVGLIRSRGFRIRVLQSRAVVYFVVSFVLLALFAVSWQPVYDFIARHLRLTEPTAGFVTGLSLFITALYLQLVILLIVDRRILGRSRHPSGTLAGEFLESPGGMVPAARSIERGAEYESLARGVIERSGKVVGRMKKYCDEMGKMFPASRENSAASGPEQTASEPPLSGLFSRARREAQTFMDFKRRFERHLSGSAATRISFSLDAVVEPVIRQCRDQWRGVEIRYQKRPRLKAFGSPEEVSLCLWEVLVNACESLARPQDGILVTAREEEHAVFLNVADHGPGMSLRHLAAAGRPFFTTKRRHDGLGLFFCRLLLERNGGSCVFRRGEERGTTVTIRLPKVKSQPVRREESNA